MLLSQKLVDHLGRVGRVHNEELEAFAQGDFDSDVIFVVDWFDKFEELAIEASASTFQILEDLCCSSVTGLDLLFTFKLTKLIACLKQLSFDNLDLLSLLH